MSYLSKTEPVSFTSENFLASTMDLVSVLAHLAGSRNLHSSQRRRDQRLEAAALSTLLQSIPTKVQPPPGTQAHVVGIAPVPQRTAARKAARTPGRLIPVETMDGLSSLQRRRYCECGQCKWCLDNLRWDRIYNEKFADPAYYDGPVIRHNSALAESR